MSEQEGREGRRGRAGGGLRVSRRSLTIKGEVTARHCIQHTFAASGFLNCQWNSENPCNEQPSCETGVHLQVILPLSHRNRPVQGLGGSKMTF